MDQPPTKVRFRFRRYRHVDSRLLKAVVTKLENPKISLFDALITGGFKFPTINESDDYSNYYVRDSERVFLGHRRNQLTRRLDEVRSQGTDKKKRQNREISNVSAAIDNHVKDTSKKHPIYGNCRSVAKDKQDKEIDNACKNSFDFFTVPINQHRLPSSRRNGDYNSSNNNINTRQNLDKTQLNELKRYFLTENNSCSTEKAVICSNSCINRNLQSSSSSFETQMQNVDFLHSFVNGFESNEVSSHNLSWSYTRKLPLKKRKIDVHENDCETDGESVDTCDEQHKNLPHASSFFI